MSGYAYGPTPPTHVDAPADEGARVLLFSGRNTSVHMWEVPQLEFEDVISDVDSVHMLAPEFNWGGPVSVGLSRAVNVARRAVGMRKRWPIDSITVDRDYELFFAVFHFPEHIGYLSRLRNLRRRCRRMACFIIEMWSREIPESAKYLRLLDEFDHIFLFNGASVERVGALLRRPCHFLPTATDAIRFCPYPAAPPRVIDCYTVGRHSPTVHQQLMDMADRGQIFYVYQTVNHLVPDYLAHRRLYLNLLKRSRYYLAYRINESRSRLPRTGGEEALATRYFEGAAAGAVMLGSAPRTPDFHRTFDWPDAVIPLPWQPTDLAAAIAELDAQPERLARARTSNVTHSLRRHDWVHRWGRVLDAVGLPHTTPMRARRARLEELAALAELAPAEEPLAPAAGGRA